MPFWEIIAILATVSGAIQLIPEVIKALKTHHLKDVAWSMLFMYFAASALWITYGFSIQQIPLIISAGFNLCMETTLIILKQKYQKHRKPLFKIKNPSILTPESLTEKVNN